MEDHMKKQYTTPELTFLELEQRDILCSSFIKYDIVERRDNSVQGETPPVSMK